MMVTRSGLLPPAPGSAGPCLAAGMEFRRGRLHEGCGRARRVLAALLAARTTGPVVWALPARTGELLFPAGVAEFFDPGRLLLVRGRHDRDLLWTLEESLRSGSAGLVVAELAAVPGLTPVRRLHLAAEAGGGQAIGLILTPGDGGAPGVESRWSLDPAPEGGWVAQQRRRGFGPDCIRLSAPADWHGMTPAVSRRRGFAPLRTSAQDISTK